MDSQQNKNYTSQEEKAQAISKLCSLIAHEINNPLFVISGKLELLIEETKEEKLKQELVSLTAQVERIRKINDRLLDFCRKPKSACRQTEINGVIEWVLKELKFDNI